MPYGISKSQGGDSPENDAHMERMVQDIMADGHDKVSAIRIAKSRFHGGGAMPKGGHKMHPAVRALHRFQSELDNATRKHMGEATGNSAKPEGLKNVGEAT